VNNKVTRRPVLRIEVVDGCVVIVGNEIGFDVLKNLVTTNGDAYAERVLLGDGTGGLVCALRCEDDEVRSVDVAHDVRIQAALDEVFRYYNEDDPLPDADRFGIVRAGLAV
jgi:hypothetical protein